MIPAVAKIGFKQKESEQDFFAFDFNLKD